MHRAIPNPGKRMKVIGKSTSDPVHYGWVGTVVSETATGARLRFDDESVQFLPWSHLRYVLA